MVLKEEDVQEIYLMIIMIIIADLVTLRYRKIREVVEKRMTIVKGSEES